MMMVLLIQLLLNQMETGGVLWFYQKELNRENITSGLNMKISIILYHMNLLFNYNHR